MEKPDKLSNLMNRVLYNMLNKHSKPQSIELRHVVEESGEKPHELAHFRLHWRVWNILFKFVEWQTQVLDEDLLQKTIDFVCWLQCQDD